MLQAFLPLTNADTIIWPLVQLLIYAAGGATQESRPL